jgi:hypothetical protein
MPITLHKIILIILLLGSALTAQAQTRARFLDVDTTKNPLKIGLVSGGILGTYGLALGGLNYYWYKDYPRSAFHSFNDSREWMGVDKAGHMFNSYYQSRWAMGMYRWTGVKNRTAVWVGGLTGTFLQSSIEILDGFSDKWGFSYYDLGANMLGSALVIGQELTWGEQRIVMKISAHRPAYPADLETRAARLYGTTAPEVLLKDYNAITTWFSFNVSSFIKRENNFPKWLNVAVGYGANGMYGGFENKWCQDRDVEFCDCDPAQQVVRTDVRRYPQFYLSLDIDLTRIKTKSKALRALFGVFNIIKIPAPTIEFNPVDKVKFHPLFF